LLELGEAGEGHNVSNDFLETGECLGVEWYQYHTLTIILDNLCISIFLIPIFWMMVEIRPWSDRLGLH
jgi:hypothetical protein